MTQPDVLVCALTSALDDRLAEADRLLATRYPGDRTDRQPVHTVYVPADRFDAHTVPSWGTAALGLLESYAPTAAELSTAVGQPVPEPVYDRLVAKLRSEPVEDLRVDLEDGYGVRPDEEEDATVARIVEALRATEHRPMSYGIRFKAFEAPTRARGVRTLVAFLSGLAPFPDGLVLTLPKVTSVDQVSAMTSVCQEIEHAWGIEAGTIRFEVQVETAQAVLGSDGGSPLPAMIDAADGRCVGLHYGTYDYSAGLGVAAPHQSLDHPVADHAKDVMQVAAAQTGVRVCDGSTNVVAFGDREQAQATWALHHRLVTRSLERGIYQGWDMHPGHLVTRYLATYLFHRRALPDNAARLRAYVERVDGGVLDEPATARMLAAALLRGVRCGALDAGEVTGMTGLDEGALLGLTR